MQKIACIFFALHAGLTSCQPKWDLVKIGEIYFDGRIEAVNRVINVNSKGAVNGLSIVFENPVDINDIAGNVRVLNSKCGYDKSFVFVPMAGNWTGRKNEFVLITGAEIPPGDQAFYLRACLKNNFKQMFVCTFVPRSGRNSAWRVIQAV